MKLLFKQRAFTWFDSYDIYDENENTVYVVKGQLSWGHCLKIFDASEEHELGTVKEQIFSWWPQFELYEGSDCIGTLKKEPWGWFKPRYNENAIPSIPSLVKICDAFQITLSEFFAKAEGSESAPVVLTPQQMKVIDRWSVLRPDQQEAVLNLLNTIP